MNPVSRGCLTLGVQLLLACCVTVCAGAPCPPRTPKHVARDLIVSDLIRALKDQDPAVRANAAEKLGDLGPDASAAAEALVGVLQDKEENVVIEASVTLSRIGSAAVPFLISALKHENKKVGKFAMSALQRMGSDASQAVPHLVAIMKEGKDEEMRSTAMTALMSIGGEATVTALLDIAMTDKSDYMRLGAIQTLGSLGPKAKRAIPALSAIMKTDFVRTPPNFRGEAAADSLACIGADAVPALVEILSEREFPASVRCKAIRALGEMAIIHGPGIPKNAVPALIKALGDKDVQIRDEVVTALGSMEKHSKAAISALKDALDDEVAKVRIGAAYALFQIEPDNRVTVPALIKGLEEKDSESRQHAAYRLSRMGPRAKLAVPALSKLLQDSDVDVRVKSIIALAHIGADAKETLPTLKAALNDKNKRVRESAAYAIKAIER